MVSMTYLGRCVSTPGPGFCILTLLMEPSALLTSRFEKREHGPLVAFKTPHGVIGFHRDHLEVAGLSTEAWESFGGQVNDATLPLQTWSSRKESSATTHKLSGPVRQVSVNVTQVCNLACSYCAAGGDGTYGDPVKRIQVEATIPSLRRILDRIPEGETFQLTFMGGEPLLYIEGIDMIAEVVSEMCRTRKLQPHFSVITNGTLFDSKRLEILKRYKMNITVSVDGPEEIHDQSRKTASGQGSFKKVEEGLTVLTENKAQLGHVLLSGVFNGESSAALIAAYQFYQRWPFDFDFTFDHYSHGINENRVFCETMDKILEDAFITGGEAKLLRIHSVKRAFEALDSQLRIENFCGAGKSFLVLDARQNLFTCPWDVGRNESRVGLMGHINEAKLKEYEEPLIEKGGCRSCWAKYLCGGGCMYVFDQTNQDKHKISPSFCFRTRSLLEIVLMYYTIVRSYEHEHTEEQPTHQVG